MAEAEKEPDELLPDDQPGDGLFEDETVNSDAPGVTWTASEFIAHEKTAGWYFALVIVTAAVTGLVYLITKDIVSGAVVVVAGLLLGVYGSHKPRQLQYTVDRSGLVIDGKHRAFTEFRYFTVSQEGAFGGITFMPLKRFAMPITIYYAPADEEKIMNVLSVQLPVEEHRPDMVDRLMQKIRF